MHPEFKNVTWILSIWIFVLLWRAVCVQGRDLSPRRSRDAKQTHELDDAIGNEDRPLRRMKRLDVWEEPMDDLPRESPQHADVIDSGPSRDLQPGKQDEVKDKRNEKVLLKILEQLQNAEHEPGVHHVDYKTTTPQPLDTGQHDENVDRTTPQPLETMSDTRNTSKVRKPKQNKTQVLDPSVNAAADIVKAASMKYGSDTPHTLIDNKVTTKVQTGEKLLTTNNVTAKKSRKPDRVNAEVVDSAKDIESHKNKQQTINDTTLRFSKIQNSKSEIIPNNVVTYSSNSLKLIPYEEFVQNVANKKKTQNIDQNVNQTNRYRDRLNKNNEMNQRHQQSLVLLQNATREAEFLQQRLKNHKLKLKSYIEVLKNTTSPTKNYTNSVREKVNDIVNPKRVNHTQETTDHDIKVKRHFFAKDISETLRARVDMETLKKSESYWDKKGDDIEEPHLRNYDLDDDILQEENREMESEDELDLSALAVDYVEDDPPLDQLQNKTETTSTTTRPPTRTDQDIAGDHVSDYHMTKLNEISVTRDRLNARTQHETFVLSQMITGRIHGNVLAPPPERCSVIANMKRYRPPDAEMNEDESLLYRANLQPEIDAAIEGAPMNYLKDYKNPCWLSKISDKDSLWYDYTETGLTYKRMSFLYEMRLSKDSNWRMRCLPYLYFVGVTKSGTTDMYSRLMGHPEIMRPGHKEPMWWNRLTLGMAESLRKPFRYYVDFFDEAAELIRRKVVMKDGKPYHPGVTVDATPANLWDYDCWTDIPGNRGLAEPKYTLANSIKKLVPGAKIVMILREPTSRLYSQYRMKSHMEPPSTFHKLVMEAIVNFNQCLETRTLRSCAYDYEISKHEFQSPGGVFIRASLYYVFVKDWLDVFSPDQVKVIRTEDYHNNTEETLHEVFDFIGLSPLPDDRLHAISRQRSVNTRADHFDRSMDPMLPETQRLLDDFFRPYNKMLAKLLRSKKWKWNDVTSMK